ncbi:MAG: universal stress protein [Nitrospirota bacterium]
MKKILIAVEDSKGSMATVDTFSKLFAQARPDEVVLLYVEKIEGRSLMDEMLGEAEMSTLKEQLKGTEYQEHLDMKAKTILNFYRKELEGNGVKNIKTIVKEGHPADEIIGAAREENVEMIIIGSRGRRLHTLLMGSVSREVSNRADIPVLIAR